MTGRPRWPPPWPPAATEPSAAGSAAARGCRRGAASPSCLLQPVEGDLGRQAQVVRLAVGRRPVGGRNTRDVTGPVTPATRASNWALGSSPSRSPTRASTGQVMAPSRSPSR